MSNVGLAGGFGAAGSCARADALKSTASAASAMRSASLRTIDLTDMCLLPCADSPAPLVEDPLVVALAHLEARLGRELTEHRRPHVEHRVVRRGTRGRNCVGPEEEAIRILLEEPRH